MSIPTEAIEAAARAMRTAAINGGLTVFPVSFYERNAELTLTAAAPYIQAAALRDAAGEADDRAEKSRVVSQNRAAHDFPTRVRYAAYAEEARCIAHVLHARADRLEGKTK